MIILIMPIWNRSKKKKKPNKSQYSFLIPRNKRLVFLGPTKTKMSETNKVCN